MSSQTPIPVIGISPHCTGSIVVCSFGSLVHRWIQCTHTVKSWQNKEQEKSCSFTNRYTHSIRIIVRLCRTWGSKNQNALIQWSRCKQPFNHQPFGLCSIVLIPTFARCSFTRKNKLGRLIVVIKLEGKKCIKAIFENYFFVV